MAESLQKWLARNRPPRVHITYDVETLGAIEKKELPFVVGILADLLGSKEPDRKLKDRKFIEIDRDNFADLLRKLGPELSFKVPNRLTGGEGEMSVQLKIDSMDSFRPTQLLEQLSGRGEQLAAGEESRKIEALAQLYEERERLAELLARIDLKDNLADLLRELIAGRAS
jgi:type VI secretion system protein ImpB